MPTRKQGPSAVSSSRYKPGKPAPKSSQSGYGHKSGSATTTPIRRDKTKR